MMIFVRILLHAQYEQLQLKLSRETEFPNAIISSEIRKKMDKSA